MPRIPLTSIAVGLALAGAAAPAPAEARLQLGDRVLRMNASGPDVRQLQQALTRLEIPTTADGQFGRGTRKSVRAYERSRSMAADGRVSRKQGRGIARRARGTDRTTASIPAPLAEVEGTQAVISADGRRAQAPAAAPPEVKAAIAAANEITDRPYRYGGGHGDFEDSGYDCSGAVSYALHGAGLLKRPLASGDMMSWGRKGRGDWITIYAHGGHAYAVIAGLRFDTSGRGEKGPRWRPESRSPRGFVARHPAGF